jgi:hypothetical protein
MDLLRAYAEKVSSYLPQKIRSETADELYDSLCEEFQEQAEQSDLSESDFVRSQIHPIKRATQLGEGEKLYLIGPGFYLSFIQAIKVAAMVVAVIHVGLFALTAWTSDNLIQVFLQTMSNYVSSFTNVAFIIGLIFIVIEKTGERADWLDSWNVKDLERSYGKQKISKFETLFELNVAVIVFLWLTKAIELPAMMRIDGVWLADMMVNIPDLVLSIMIGMLAFDILVSAFKLLRGYWSSMLRVATLVSSLIWIGLLVAVIQIDELVVEALFAGVVDLDMGNILGGINTGIDISLTIAIVIIAWDSVTQAYRLSQKN